MNNFSDSFSGLSGLGIITIIFTISIIALGFYILTYLFIVNKRDSKLERWKFLADTLIRNAIFFEEDQSASSATSLLKVLEVNIFPIPERVKKILPDPHFRQLMMRELIAAKQNMTGAASVNLKNLFRQLELDQDALEMVRSNSWYLKASGIQYLGIMEMAEHKNLVMPFTNSKSGLVRVEAQNAILKFSGFDGLRFLDDASFPITEWQQIKILEELAQLPTEHFTGIEKWLKSSNDTVVIFALKLARNYFRFELYDHVISCLNHANPEVRYNAILAAKQLQTETTASDILKFYEFDTERNQLAIIRVLEDLRSENNLPFLLNVFLEESNQLKIAAAKAIVAIENGVEQLELQISSNQYPYNEIIRQVKTERK
ncbi:HEAT repeat domain-containing protein [Daejeonella lutea]|uniref:HEAT repeat-containing protein n=1 Tax=Daejeonella lutea TaxID=572036 RepID=A0A1T5A8X7_9SPHI|nr:HEAT repeat domain-containing protein [Daejeonella lutea]SKB31187.1 hypothetical protein SAMN05661099_0435 [Daejeonella lutea]